MNATFPKKPSRSADTVVVAHPDRDAHVQSFLPEVVHGIRAFVASAVGGVDPKAIVVLDDRGAVSADGAEESSGGNALEQSLQGCQIRVSSTALVRGHRRLRGAHSACELPLRQRSASPGIPDERGGLDRHNTIIYV